MSRRTFHLSDVAFVLCLALVASSGCDDSSQPDDAFFDPGTLEEGAALLGDDFTVVPCPGAREIQRWEWHPRLVRGQVLAPGGALALSLEPTEDSLADLFVSTAWAVPLEGESTVADATAKLVRDGEVVSTTITDALGRFCLVVPEGAELGPSWRVEATQGDLSLRRVVLDASEADVSVHTEAVYRIAHGPQAPALPAHRWRNLHTVSATTLDLVSPLEITPGMSTEAAVEVAVEKLQADERFTALLDPEL